MSKVLGPLFSLDARGTIKKTLVFQGAGASGKVNQYKKQKDAETERQLLVRTLFDEARQRWNAASSETKAFWNAKAKFRKKTGYDLFLQNSINNLRTMDYTILHKIPMTRIKKGAKPPDDEVVGLFYCLKFGEEGVEANEEFVFASIHILTDYKPGSDINIALYWFSLNETTGSVKWEVSVVSVEHDSAETPVKAPTVETILSAVNPNLSGIKETAKVVFPGSLFDVHDVLGIKIKRKSADVQDTLSGDVHLLMLECYYTSDRLGEKV